MPYAPIHQTSGFNLQATLSATSALGDGTQPAPHHPISCPSKLFLEEDGSFSCEHATVAPGDARTQACLVHSVALLLIELAFAL